MVIELTGVRLLAPLFGSSIFTWTALIGVVLVGISLGGIVGGSQADSESPRFSLFDYLMLCSIFTLAIPLFYFLFGGAVRPLGNVSGPTLMAVILFAIPAFLLGAVSPIITRLVSRVSSDNYVGFASGITNMSGALGSFAGTFAAGLYLIPTFDYRTIYIATAVTLALCAFLYLFTSTLPMIGKKIFIYVCALIIVTMAVVATIVDTPEHVAYETETQYQRVALLIDSDDNGDFYLSMYNDNSLQGSMYFDRDDSPHPYKQYWDVAKLQLPSIRKALVLGGGAYSYPKEIEKDYPKAEITVVELDRDVSLIAQAFFRLDDYENIKTVNDDARRFLSTTQDKYDFVVVDVFKGFFQVPSHLVTAQFFGELKSVLTPNGVVLMNIIGADDEEGSRAPHALYNTVDSVFADTLLFAAEREDDSLDVRNFMIMASDNLKEPSEFDVEDPKLSALLKTYISNYSESDTTNGVVFTDFKNPIERYIADLIVSYSK